MRNTGTAATLVALAFTATTAAAAPICGDVNESGGVNTSDALLVLREAVGLDVGLICPLSMQTLSTGQTIGFGVGSDGQLQNGAVRDFTDNGDGTVTDEATGLMWEKKDAAGGLHDRSNTYTWADSGSTMNGSMVDEFLVALNAGQGFAGHTDWRIPNINELDSLKLYGISLGQATFDEFNTDCEEGCTVTQCSCTLSAHYWSSTTNQHAVDEAFGVEFNVGATTSKLKTLLSPVRAVRDAL